MTYYSPYVECSSNPIMPQPNAFVILLRLVTTALYPFAPFRNLRYNATLFIIFERNIYANYRSNPLVLGRFYLIYIVLFMLFTAHQFSVGEPTGAMYGVLNMLKA